MKKLIVTEAQYKMLQREGLEYTPEKIDEFVIEARQTLEKGKKMVRDFYNIVASTNIGDIIENREQYNEMSRKMNKMYKNYENSFNKYYDIVQMYDYMDFPDNVSKLDRIVAELDTIQNDLYVIQDRFDDIIDATDRLTEYSNMGGEVNEQLLKKIKDKLTKTNDSNIETNVPGQLPSKKRDLDQLKAEWSKINQDTSNMKGYGEAVSPNMNAAHTSAMMKAKVAILKKMGKQEARFGANIVDEALFQLENGNYMKLVVLEPTQIWEK